MTTIISSTNRANSNSLKVAKYYQNQLKTKGLSAEILSLEDLPANILETDMFGKRSPNFQKIQDVISKTEKYLFIIPEYNGSFPGVLKTFIDACSFPESFYGKKAALVGIASGKYGNIRGIDHFTGVCHYVHLNVMPLRLHISNIKDELNADGNFIKEDTIKFVNEQIDKFIQF